MNPQRITGWRVKEWAVVTLLVGLAAGVLWFGASDHDRGLIVGGLGIVVAALTWLHLMAAWNGG